MKLERIKNTNPMQASEMAMVLGGATYCAGATGGGTYTKTQGTQNPTSFKYCNDVKATTYNSDGTNGGNVTIHNLDDAVSAEKLLSDYIKGRQANGDTYIGECS